MLGKTGHESEVDEAPEHERFSSGAVVLLIFIFLVMACFGFAAYKLF